MCNEKNLIKAVLLSVVIVIGFCILFEILGFQQEQTGIAVATILVFTMLLCTYSIIDEIKRIKNKKE